MLPEFLFGFWGLNPANSPPVILRDEPPNLARVAYALCFLFDLNACHHLSLTAWSSSPHAAAWLGQPSSRLGQHGLYAISTCILACRCPPSVSHPRLVLWPSVPRSKPLRWSFTTLSPSARTRFRLSALHPHITRQETCWTTPLTPYS
jgi:hypothetical protein